MEKSEVRKIADEIIKKLKNISQEEFERNILKLNGTMNGTLFEKVMKEVYRLQSLDYETLRHETIDTDVTIGDFSEVFHYIQEYARSRDIIKDFYNNSFPEYRLYFKYRGGNFTWRMLIGQCATMQIHAQSYDNWPEENPLVFQEEKAFEMLEVDKKVKYYKPDN